MSYTNFSEFQPSASTVAVPGFWKLTPGCALSLQPRQTGMLRIAQGQVWATLDVPHSGAGNQSGDHLLQVGQEFAVMAGQHLVVEPLQKGGASPVFFEWTPNASGFVTGSDQGASVVTQPLQDLGQALTMAGAALARLGAGVLAYAGQHLGMRPSVPVSHCSS